MTKIYLTLFFCILLFTNCKTTNKSYQKGHYQDAFGRGVKKLQKNPDDRETIDVVQQSYNFILHESEDRIRILSNSRTEDKYEKMYEQYLSLQHLYEVIHQYPAVARVVTTTDFSEFVNTYAYQSAMWHQNKADRWIEQATKIAYREAYQELNLALHYQPQDFEIRKKRDAVYDMALTKVIITPIQNYGGYQQSSSYQIQNFQRDILRTLSNNLNQNFVRFYSEWEVRSEDIEADQVMELNLGRITFGQPYDNHTVREVSKEIVMKEIVYKPDSVVKKYGTVTARITNTKRTLLSQGDLFIALRDTKGRTIWSDRFTGEHTWQSEIVSYTGDERALSDSDRSLLNQRNDTPPSQDQIMEELLRQIQNDLTRRLRDYYSRLQ